MPARRQADVLRGGGWVRRLPTRSERLSDAIRNPSWAEETSRTLSALTSIGLACAAFTVYQWGRFDLMAELFAPSALTLLWLWASFSRVVAEFPTPQRFLSLACVVTGGALFNAHVTHTVELPGLAFVSVVYFLVGVAALGFSGDADG
ncbi:MAG: hypothetical protein HN750_16270 [Gemmatimonadales bacterium]|nr:hypothetical protein [Gemmatimonadales bacterium]